MAEAGVLFAVGSGTQWEDALRIAACAPDLACRILDLQSLVVGAPAPPGTTYGGRHWPRQGARTVTRLLHLLRDELPSAAAVVLGQDAGRLQRVVARAAKRRRVPVVVVPDGAMFDCQPPRLPRREHAEERLLEVLGISAGRPLEFGATSPDVWCAWGDGWVELLERFSPRGDVVVTGSPRAADLAALPARVDPPRRLLLCSQPTWVHPFPPSATAGPRWYRWVDAVVASAPPGTVGVRFHPRERDIVDELGLSPALRALAAVPGRPLASDLARHDAVVAPYSTVLLEAAGAGRRVLSVIPEDACRTIRFASPPFADPRLSVRLVTELPSFADVRDAIAASDDLSDWGAAFAPPLPDAAARCAAVVRQLVAASR